MAGRLKTLIFPALNTVIFLVLLLVQIIDSNRHFDEVIEVVILMTCTILFGGIIGGILPLTIALIYKIDISDHFVHQVIIIAISIAVCFLSFMLGVSGMLFIIAPIIWGFMTVMFWVNITSKKNELSMQKVLVLSLSNPLMLYIGFVLDLSNSFFLNIPG